MQNSHRILQTSEVIDSFGFGRFHVIVLIIGCIANAAESMEMLLLAILGPHLECEWRINSTESALLTTVVFAGMIVGAPIVGLLADKYGRRIMYIASSFAVGYFGLLSAFTINLNTLLVTRALVGACIGGLVSTHFPLILELMPMKYRTIVSVILVASYSAGGMFECVLAFITLPTLGWRWLLILTAIYALLSAIPILYIPETPHFLMTNHREVEAVQVLDRIAETNKQPPYRGIILKPNTTSNEKSTFFEIWHPNYRSTVILVCFLWLAIGMTYYGLILVITNLPNSPRRCNISFTTNARDTSCCNSLTSKTFTGIIISSAGEFLALPVVGFGMELIGRRMTMGLSMFALSITFLLKNICLGSVIFNIVSFIGRLFALVALTSNALYTAEVFPTSIRTFSNGFTGSFTRIGAMITPFIAQVLLMQHSSVSALLIYAFVAFLAGIMALLLPYETKNTELMETVDEKPQETSLIDRKIFSFEKMRTTYKSFTG